jgi:hypothetical protein
MVFGEISMQNGAWKGAGKTAGGLGAKSVRVAIHSFPTVFHGFVDGFSTGKMRIATRHEKHPRPIGFDSPHPLSVHVTGF